MLELKIGLPQANEIIDPASTLFKWATLFIESVSSAAWPLAVFAVAFLFRKNIRDLLERIVSVNGGGIAFGFAQKLEAAREASANVQSDADHIPSQDAPSASADAFFARTNEEPLVAILTAFKRVENQLQEITGVGDRRAIVALTKLHVIPKDTLRLYQQLLSTRNAALHEPDRRFSPYEVAEYSSLVEVLVSALATVAPTAAAQKNKISELVATLPAISQTKHSSRQENFSSVDL